MLIKNGESNEMIMLVKKETTRLERDKRVAVLLFPLMAGILEFLVAALDRVAAGGRGAEHRDSYRYLADRKLQVHLAQILPSHLS